MGQEKDISKKSYIWGHVGVIIYHSLTAILLIMSQYMNTLYGIGSRNFVIIAAIILLIVSLLSLWPILKDYDKIVIE